jgi:hypothetical protein
MAGPESGDSEVKDNSGAAEVSAKFDAAQLQTPSTDAISQPSDKGLDKQMASVSDLSSFPKTDMWSKGGDSAAISASAASMAQSMPFNQKSLIRSA